MKRLVIAGLAIVALGGIAGSAVASDHAVQGASLGKSRVIYDSTPSGPLPGNLPSLGAEAYSFESLGDKIRFAPGGRNLVNAVVVMSSWACQQGTWQENCSTHPGATFSQPITFKILSGDGKRELASSTQTFRIPYRPSASAECASDPDRPGGWYDVKAKRCFNGLATKIAFNFAGNVKLPDAVVYEISYDTSNHGPNPLHARGPYDSLNIAMAYDAPSVGSTADDHAWADGAMNSGDDFAGTPAVQLDATRLSKVG